MGVNLEQTATEANSTDFVSSNPPPENKPRRNPLGESFEKDPNIFYSYFLAYSLFFSHELGKKLNI